MLIIIPCRCSLSEFWSKGTSVIPKIVRQKGTDTYIDRKIVKRGGWKKKSQIVKLACMLNILSMRCRRTGVQFPDGAWGIFSGLRVGELIVCLGVVFGYVEIDEEYPILVFLWNYKKNMQKKILVDFQKWGKDYGYSLIDYEYSVIFFLSFFLCLHNIRNSLWNYHIYLLWTFL